MQRWGVENGGLELMTLPATPQATQFTRQTAKCAIHVFCPSPRAAKADVDPFSCSRVGRQSALDDCLQKE